MPGAWELDLQALRKTLVDKGEGLARRLSHEYRSAEKQLSGLFHQPRPSDLNTRLKLIDTIVEAHQYQDSTNQLDSLGAELFGLKWNGQASEWEALSQLSQWIQDFHASVERCSGTGGIVDYLSGNPDKDLLGSLVSAVEEATEAHAASASAIRNGLESARKELLDLGLRNPLLNYRLLRTRGLEVVDEVAAEVYRLLTIGGKAMSFLPGPTFEDSNQDTDQVTADALGQPTEQESEEEEAVGSLTILHTDSRLQTGLSSEELQHRLLSTYHLANTFIQEKGVNTLFLALGMLIWRVGDGDEPRKAPLVLVPVALDRTNVRSRF